MLDRFGYEQFHNIYIQHRKEDESYVPSQRIVWSWSGETENGTSNFYRNFIYVCKHWVVYKLLFLCLFFSDSIKQEN